MILNLSQTALGASAGEAGGGFAVRGVGDSPRVQLKGVGDCLPEEARSLDAG